MTELLLLAGLPAHEVEWVIGRIVGLDDDVAVLHHDLADLADGVVRRRLRRGGRDETTELRLARPCASCALREDLLPLLRKLAGGPRRVVLHLDPALEPEQVCFMLTAVRAGGAVVTDLYDLRGVVTVVDAATWLDDATGHETTAERALAGCADDGDDLRTVAQVAVAQAEFADVIVRTGTADAWRLARTDAVLARLAPAALRLRLSEVDERVLLGALPAEARRGVPDDVHGPLLRGRPPLDADCGVRTLLFTARRPFHPLRLHAAVDVLLDGVVRARGRVWLATRPAAVLWLESAGGGLQIGHAGEWLAAQGEAGWAAASPERRAMAALRWDARFGDRAQDLVVLTHRADPDEIEAWLQEALLSDAELAAGEPAWAALPDPFGRWHADPCGDGTGGALTRGEEGRGAG